MTTEGIGNEPPLTYEAKIGNVNQSWEQLHERKPSNNERLRRLQLHCHTG